LSTPGYILVLDMTGEWWGRK